MTHYSRGEHTPTRTGRAARTRVGNHMSVARRQAVLTAQAGRVNSGRVTTADYLRRLGADDAFVNSYSSPYGRAAAKVYREQTGAEPAKSGLAVRGRRLVPVFAYGADDAAILDKAARTYARTAALVTGRPAAQIEAAAAPVEGTAPVVLVAELAERHELPAGFAAQRVEAILATMRSNPRLYDAQRGLLAPGGAAVIRSVVHAEDSEGLLRVDADAWQHERNALGQDVAEVLRPGGQTTHQVARFLAAA